MKKAVLSVASNVPEGLMKVIDTLDWLEKSYPPFRCSSTYGTKALHGNSTYWNAVATVWCNLSCKRLNQALKLRELEEGRTEEMRQQEQVPIDIDIVIYDGKVLRPKDFEQDFFQIGWKELKKSDK